MEIVEKEPF